MVAITPTIAVPDVRQAADLRKLYNMRNTNDHTKCRSHLLAHNLLTYLYFINRCPVDPSIFPAFTPEGNALQSVYEAFRFTESYGVIFQCNVKYCLGPCEPVNISHFGK